MSKKQEKDRKIREEWEAVAKIGLEVIRRLGHDIELVQKEKDDDKVLCDMQIH